MPLPGMGEGLEREGAEERQSLLEDSHSCAQSSAGIAYGGTCETPLQAEKGEQMIK